MLCGTPFSLHAREVRVSARPLIIAPTAVTIGAWLEHVYDGPQIWRFRDRAHFDAFLGEPSLSAALRGELRALYASGASLGDDVSVDAHFEVGDSEPEGVLRVSEDVWRRLPRAFLNATYTRFARASESSLGLMFYLPAQFTSLADELAKLAAGPKDVGALVTTTLEVDGRTALVLTPFNWRHLDLPTRLRVIDHLTLERGAARGLACSVKVTAATAPDLARTFGGGEAADVLARLRERLRTARGRSLSVDLRDLLPTFIREYVNTYATLAGPNCYNAALNVARAGVFTLAHVSAADFAHRLRTEYRFVPPGEALRVGDLLVYGREAHRPEPVHVATYVTEDIVFTKNGLTKFQPYMFQNRRQMIAGYAPDGVYREVAYRKVSRGERPLGAAYAGPQPARFEHALLREAADCEFVLKLSGTDREFAE